MHTALPAGLIDGFERRRLPGDGVEIDALVGGAGPPLLLLHGYPQTRVMWKAIAPALAERFTVVVPDLRGYGRSEKPEGDAAHARYSKRAWDAIRSPACAPWALTASPSPATTAAGASAIAWRSITRKR